MATVLLTLTLPQPHYQRQPHCLCLGTGTRTLPHCFVFSSSSISRNLYFPSILLCALFLFCSIIFFLPIFTVVTGQCSDSFLTPLPNADRCPFASRVIMNSVTGAIYAGCGNGILSINGSNAIMIPNRTDLVNARDVDVNTRSGVVYAATQTLGLISINVSTISTLGAQRCSNFQAVHVNSETGIVYAACEGGVISINGSTVTTLANSTQCPLGLRIDVNTVTGIVYAACMGTGVISIDGSIVTAIANSTRCPDPLSVAVNSVTGIVYAAFSGGIISINGSTIKTLATFSQCRTASSVFVNTVTGVVYAACERSGVISIDHSGITTLATIVQCGSPRDVYVNSATGIVYAACLAGLLSIHGPTLTKLPMPDQSASTESVYVDSGTGTVYAASQDAGVISIHGSTIVTLANGGQCPYPCDVDVNRVTGIVYGACGCDGENGDIELIAINGSTVNTLPISSQCDFAHSVHVDSVTGVVYVACTGGGLISINGSTVVALANWRQCWKPRSVDVNSRTGVVYAACADDSVISISGSSVVALTDDTQCSDPTSVYVNSVTGIVYATCTRSGVISINGSTVTTVATSAQCGHPLSVYMNIETGILYATCMVSGVISIDGFVSTTLATSVQCPYPKDVYFDSVTHIVYAACANGIVAIASNFGCPEGYSWSAGECLPCQAGKFRNSSMVVAAYSHCVSCAAGAASGTGAINCVECSPGWYALAGAPFCNLCWPGTFASTSGQSICSSCPAGTFGSIAGLSSPSCSGSCLPGYVCPEGSIIATQIPCGAASVYCPAGSNSSTPVSHGHYTLGGGSDQTRTNQQPCETGSYCINGVNTSCPAGTYANTTAQTSCSLCPAGTFGASEGLTSAGCSGMCPVGHYCLQFTVNPTPCSDLEYYCPQGSALPKPIPSGYFRMNASSIKQCWPGTSCLNGVVTNCSAGSFSYRGSDACIPCWVGTAQPVAGQSVCPPCKAGKYQSQEGQTTCVACVSGTISNNADGASECSPCLPPSTPIDDNTACSQSKCSAGSYDDGQSHCPLCPVGQYSPAGGMTNCLLCGTNTYNSMNGSDGCLPCDGLVGIECLNGLATVQPGYWGYLSNIDGKIQVRAVVCPAGYCPGSATLTYRTLPTQSGELAVQLVTTGSSCGPHHLISPDNVLCGVCDEGYMEWRGNCIECDTPNKPVIFVLVLMSFVFLAIIFLTSESSRSGDSKILLYFVQTAIFQIGSFDQWLSWLGFINFDAQQSSGSNCIAPITAYQSLALGAVIPLFLAAELLSVLIIHFTINKLRHTLVFVCQKSFRKLEDVSSPAAASSSSSFECFTDSVQLSISTSSAFTSSSFPFARYVRAGIEIVLYSYQQVTISTLRYLQCVSVDKQSVVFTKPSIHCDSAEYHRWLPAVILLLILDVCLVPCCIGWLLWTRQAEIKKRLCQQQSCESSMVHVHCRDECHVVPSTIADASSSPDAASEARLDAYFGGLYECYGPHAFWMKPFVLLRQVLLVGLSVAFSQSHSDRYVAYTYFNIAVFCFHVIRPYRVPIDNNIEYAALLLLCIISISIGFSDADTGTGRLPISEQVVLFVLVAPFAIVLLLYILILRIQRLHLHCRMTQRQSDSDESDRFSCGDSHCQGIGGQKGIPKNIPPISQQQMDFGGTVI